MDPVEQAVMAAQPVLLPALARAVQDGSATVQMQARQ